MKLIRFSWLIPAVALLLFWPSLGAQTQHSIVVTWGASSTSGAQYNVYRGTATGGPYSKLTAVPVSALTYTDTTGVAGTKYFYVETAVCPSGGSCPAGIIGESGFGPEASATFLGSPNPPVAPVAATAN